MYMQQAFPGKLVFISEVESQPEMDSKNKNTHKWNLESLQDQVVT